MNNVPYPAQRTGSWNSDGLHSSSITPYISEKALRYDLTVPFARHVSMHAHELVFPFKRFQIQPVWRADRPQKSRYREFIQCDADVIGSESLIYEAEFISIFEEVFQKLCVDKIIHIRINHRNILNEFASWAGNPHGFVKFCNLMDKTDKMPFDTLLVEFKKSGFDGDKMNQIWKLKNELYNLNALEACEKLEEFLSLNGCSSQGTREIKTILADAINLGASLLNVRLDLSLARGLDYYTGSIFEATPTVGGSSVAGGGRYDNLTGRFGKTFLSGTGISFGADRLFDLMSDLKIFNLIPIHKGPDVIFTLWDDSLKPFTLNIIGRWRKIGISCELFPSMIKLKKQLEIASKKEARYVAIIGPDEAAQGIIALKNLQEGWQKQLHPDAAAQYIKNQ